MTRPRTVSDDAILDAVLNLVYRVGPARVTLASVAAEVGLSAATLVQRFGTKRMLLLAADQKAIDGWVGSLERASDGSALDRVVDGLVLAVKADLTATEMAHAVALLQLDLADPDFHAQTLAGAQAVRYRIRDLLAEALTASELRASTDLDELAAVIETTYHGAQVGWAIHREGDLGTWVRRQIEAVLAPHRLRPGQSQEEQKIVITRTSTAQVRAGLLAEFTAVIVAAVRQFPRDHPGLVHHEVLTDETRNELVYLSRWRDEAALVSFAGTDWATQAVTLPGEDRYLAAPLRVRHYRSHPIPD